MPCIAGCDGPIETRMRSVSTGVDDSVGSSCIGLDQRFPNYFSRAFSQNDVKESVRQFLLKLLDCLFVEIGYLNLSSRHHSVASGSSVVADNLLYHCAGVMIQAQCAG